MPQESSIIDRLFNSFEELEDAIQGARKTLESRESVPQEVMERLGSYDSILSKQRRIASDLCQYIEKEDWDEVGRCVSLINGLSAMIRDDARAILSSLSLNSDNETTEDYSVC